MATLDNIIAEQNSIHEELERIAADPDTTEEADGNMRDTLVARWKALDEERAKIVSRMEELALIRKAAEDPANRETGDGGGTAWQGTGPQFLQRHDPFKDLSRVREHLVAGPELVARAANAVESWDRRGLLPGGRGEVATQRAQQPGIARHMLMYGHDEYYDAFRAYLADPTGEGLQRAAGALSLAAAQGGYLLPTFLDQLQVA